MDDLRYSGRRDEEAELELEGDMGGRPEKRSDELDMLAMECQQ